MSINENHIRLRPLDNDDIVLLRKWLDKQYVKKWFGRKEDWLNEINQRNGSYDFMKHYIVCHNQKEIGYCLYADCFFLKDLKEEGHDFNDIYGDVAEANHTYEIGYLIGEEEFLNKGISKIVIRRLEELIAGLGGKEIAADPAEENVFSVRSLLANGFTRKKEGDYRKIIPQVQK